VSISPALLQLQKVTFIHIAIMEFKLLLAHLVRDLVFEDTGKKIEEYIAGTLQAFCEGKAAYLPLRIRSA